MQHREHTVEMQIYVTEPNRNTHIYFFLIMVFIKRLSADNVGEEGMKKTGSDYFDVNY